MKLLVLSSIQRTRTAKHQAKVSEDLGEHRADTELWGSQTVRHWRVEFGHRAFVVEKLPILWFGQRAKIAKQPNTGSETAPGCDTEFSGGERDSETLDS